MSGRFASSSNPLTTDAVAPGSPGRGVMANLSGRCIGGSADDASIAAEVPEAPVAAWESPSRVALSATAAEQHEVAQPVQQTNHESAEELILEDYPDTTSEEDVAMNGQFEFSDMESSGADAATAIAARRQAFQQGAPRQYTPIM